MTRSAALIAALWDARLFLTFTHLGERLGGPEAARLREEQAAWIKEREEAALGAFSDQDGGAIGPMEESLARSEWTEKRNVELWARLIALEKKAEPRAMRRKQPGETAPRAANPQISHSE
jgi:hypothetical protein